MHPTQADVLWMFKEMLAAQKIKPTPVFVEQIDLFHPIQSQAGTWAA